MIEIAVISDGTDEEYKEQYDYVCRMCEYIGNSIEHVTIYRVNKNDNVFVNKRKYDLIFSLCLFPRLIKLNYRARRNRKLLKIVSQWKCFSKDRYTHILYEYRDELNFNVEQYMRIKGLSRRQMYDVGGVIGFK